jgi:hypothetical protein
LLKKNYKKINKFKFKLELIEYTFEFAIQTTKVLKKHMADSKVSSLNTTGLFGSTEGEGRCGEGFLRSRDGVKHNLLC